MREAAMRSRVLAPVLAPAIMAATISMLAACGATATYPAQAGHQSSAAAQSGQSGPSGPSGPSVLSAPHGAGPAPSHASAAAPPSPGKAAKHARAQPGPQAGK